MHDILPRRSTLRFILSIKPRLFLLIGLSLAILFLTIVFIGIRENRQNVLRLMKDEARALAESIISAGQNAIEANDMVDNLVLDNLADISALVSRRFEEGGLESEDVARICQSTGINRMDVIDSTGKVAVSSVVDMVGRTYDSSFAQMFPFDDIVMGRVRSASFVLGGDNPVIPAQIVLATSGFEEPGAVVLFADYSILDQFGERIGIGSLVRKIGSVSGVEYVFVQAEEGVIFASRDIGQVLKVGSDDFLSEIIDQGGYGSRVLDFEGREVLEVARHFEATGVPPGVLRIGLSMAGYQQITGNFEAQLIAIGLILFVVSFLVTTLFLANLNYRALEDSFLRMRTMTGNILDAMQSAVVATDSKGLISLFNPRAEQMFGMKASKVIGQPYAAIFSSDPLLLSEISRQPSTSIRREQILSAKEGGSQILLVAASRVMSDDNRVLGAVSVSYDLTESRSLERSAKRSERLSELGNLAAGVAHEIRNPLNAISIAAQRLRSEFEPRSEKSEYDSLVRNIKSEIDRLNDIITQFLALARSNVPARDIVQMSALVDEVAGLMRQEAEAHGIGMSVRTQPNLKVEGSREDLKKTIVNLVKNSIEACKQGDRIDVSAQSSGNRIVVAVEDSGPGIPSDLREKIFRPYFTTKQSGTGLGLALSYRIVADHDGALDYESSPGGGARFVINLPSSQKERA